MNKIIGASCFFYSFKEPLFIVTFPSYSRRERTSGAMYAGVPTVDLGFEWSKEDCRDKSILWWVISINEFDIGMMHSKLKSNLGVTKITDFESRSRVSIE